MHMPAFARSWTRAEVLAIPDDGNRYELLDGELLVSPSPRGVHQRAVGELYLLVAPYVRVHRIGGACLAPADLDLRWGQLLQPDLFVGTLVDGREPVDWEQYGIPLLVVEVLSPSTARYDRLLKRKKFQRAGVSAYWVVDPDARVVDVWRPDDARALTVDDVLRWEPSPNAPALEIDLGRYFRSVWAD